MKKKLKIIIYSFVTLFFIFITLFFLLPNKCENDFKAYPEKGYCEFNLKTCESLFGCKEYSNVQVPCGSVSTLCGEKVLCDCGDSSGNEITGQESKNKSNNLPNSFKADYISFQNYGSNIFKVEDYKMPGLRVVNGEIECEETGLSPSMAKLSSEVITNKKEINGKKYCVMYSVEGAAGAIFSQNAYTTVINNNVYLVLFTTRYNNCGNYPEVDLLKCHQERVQFNLDELVDQEIEKMRI